jgi:hypothetical protein
MPTSCADLQRTGHKLSGFFSVKGAKKMEMIYCNFFANQNGTTCFNFICYCSSKSFIVYRQTEMDWIRRRQICARPFLRPEKLYILQRINSDPVRFGDGERGKCHGFDVGDLHGTATGNLFFLFRGNGASFIFGFLKFFSFLEQ